MVVVDIGGTFQERDCVPTCGCKAITTYSVSMTREGQACCRSLFMSIRIHPLIRAVAAEIDATGVALVSVFAAGTLLGGCPDRWSARTY